MGLPGLRLFWKSSAGFLTLMAPLTLVMVILFDERFLVVLATLVGVPSCLLWLASQAPRIKVATASALASGWLFYALAESHGRGIALASALSLALGLGVVALTGAPRPSERVSGRADVPVP
jgi:hypothetical protein